MVGLKRIWLAVENQEKLSGVFHKEINSVEYTAMAAQNVRRVHSYYMKSLD